MPHQGLLSASGVVLARSQMGEGGLWLTLFLKGQGLMRASAPGAERGRVRLGGGTEPFVWGAFSLHRGRNGGLYVNGVDIADDMLPLRRRPEALRLAVRWSKRLMRWLMPDHPDDALLANLYWNMRLLSAPSVPCGAVGWRFLWRWLTLWGIAPELRRCSLCGRPPERAAWNGEGLVCPTCAPGAMADRPVFSAPDLALLLRVAGLDVDGVKALFSEDPAPRSGLFELACRCVEGLVGQDIRAV